MPCSGMLRRLALVRTDILEEIIASIIRVTRIGELEKSSAVTIATDAQILHNKSSSRKYHTSWPEGHSF
jgi:hypothetical protein